MDALFAAVDFSTVAAFVGTAGLAIVGFTMVMKGIGIAKRAISKA